MDNDIQLTPIPRYEPPAVLLEDAPPDPEADRIWSARIADRGNDQP